MIRKSTFILSTFLLSMLFLCSTALAGVFPIGMYFDTGGNQDWDDDAWFYGIKMDTYSEDRIGYTNLSGEAATAAIATYQSFGADGILGSGDTFTQDMTFTVDGALNIDADVVGGLISFEDNWKVDINLEGYIDDFVNFGTDPVDVNNREGIKDTTFTSKYTGGSAKIYHVDEDGVEIAEIAGFKFSAGTDTILSESFWKDEAKAATSFRFDWISANYDYLKKDLYDPAGLSLEDLITLNLAFATTQDSINVGDNLGEIDNGVLVPTTTTGIKAEFKAVPEPTTLLLFGTGLLGLGILGRRKFMPKK